MAKQHLKAMDTPTVDPSLTTDQSPTANHDAPPAPRKRGRKPVILAVVALAAIGFGGWEGVAYWTTGRFIETTDDAYIKSDITLISSRIQGYVAKVSVASNDHVQAGDVIAQLDDGDLRNGLALAESRYQTAGAALTRITAQIDAASSTVIQKQAERDTAQAQLRTARTKADRATQLATERVASQAQLDTATEALDIARAGLASAEAGIASAQAQVAVLRAQYAEAEGQRQELKIAVDQARRDLSLTVLTAPADGIVANMTLEPGDLVTPGARLAALIPDGSFYVEANMKETQMSRLGAGAMVEMTFDALPDQTFEGHVASVSPATGAIFSLLPADNATGNFTKIVQRVPVRITIPQTALATGKLRAGLSTEIAIDIRTTPAPSANAGE
ncbi:HlyD family secretion protein [Celeribacter sp.]|uniref:HlyD family secretion protein n=1 Tax=Celeribacter sp. TaxID=1890673 RepID=UPI003A902527